MNNSELISNLILRLMVASLLIANSGGLTEFYSSVHFYAFFLLDTLIF